MSGAERARNELSEYLQDEALFIDAFNKIRKIMQCDEFERSDIWSASWHDLEQLDSAEYIPEYEQENRMIARNHVYSVYWNALEDLYPPLLEVDSTEETIEILDGVDLPQWDGTYSASVYQSDDGAFISWTYTEVELEGHGVTTLSTIMTEVQGFAKCYKLYRGADGMMRGVVETATEEDPTIEEMIRKVPLSQRYNLASVFGGNIEPYELEAKLIEIEMLAKDEMDEYELMAILECARLQYYLAVSDKQEKAQNGSFTMKSEDLREIHRIISERSRQLDTY